MSRPRGPGTLWTAARESARVAEGPIWTFGAEPPRAVPVDSLPGFPPFSSSSLAPAVRAAAQAGHGSARVVTDGEVSDAAAVAEEAARYGMRLQWVVLRTAYPRIGIADVKAPAWAEVGEAVEVRALVTARAEPGVPAALTVRDSTGRARARSEVLLPAEGRLAEARLSWKLGAPEGLQRFEVALEDSGGDEETRDDRRSFYIDVSGPPSSPVLLALEPSWEASFLLPSLTRAGVSQAVGYTRVRPDRWVTMGEGYRTVRPEEIVRRGAGAPLLVVVGYGRDAPAWVHRSVRSAPTLWIFPAGPAFEVPGWGVRVGSQEEGEWYADATLPPSPLTGVLAGIDVSLFPPLTGVRAVEGPAAWSPLRLRRGRRGEARPAIVAGVAGGRRWAISAGTAYWRWGFRPGAPGELYRGLTTGLAGWLLEDRGVAQPSVVPLARVVARGERFRFLLPAAADSTRLLLRDTAGAVAREERRSAPGDTLTSEPLPVGRYRYEAQAWRGGRVAAAGEGPLEVEAFHPELLPAPVVDAVVAARTSAGGGGPEGVPAPRAEARLRLRRLGWPLLLLLALLCGEWVLRQRLGLR